MVPKIYILYILISVLTMISAQVSSFFDEQCGFSDWRCSDGSCVPRSRMCDGFADCSDGFDEEHFACGRVRCPLGYFYCGDSCIDAKLTCDGVKNCANGLDEVDELCRSCLPTPHIENGSVDIDISETIQDRKSEDKESKKFKISCRSGYALGKGSLRCINGTWTGIAPACVKCGTVTPGPRRVTPEGDSYQFGVAPWHVGVYSKLKRPYKLICGGTLITAKFVLSAAQCFWDDAVGLLPAPIFAVAVGKVYSGWDDDYDSQSSDVDDVKVPESFIGETNDLMYNIAFVTLASSFEFTKYVRPVCLNFGALFIHQQIDEDNMVGVWRPRSSNIGSQIANALSVEGCETQRPRNFLTYSTSDKICATFSVAAPQNSTGSQRS